MKPNENWVGKKVRAMDKDEAFAPYKGAIGTVLEFDGEDEDMPCRVFWDDNQLDMWIIKGSIELVEDDSTTMPYDEIWKMLKPKMEKNGMRMFAHPTYGGLKCFYETDISQKAVALAYKMGYERAMKGRPFKYGEKKVKKVEGHWEKVDPENLPKDGTRVRYAREDGREHYNRPSIGDEGVVEWHGGSGIGFRRNDGTWTCVMGDPSCLDYWVEGDDVD